MLKHVLTPFSRSGQRQTITSSSRFCSSLGLPLRRPIHSAPQLLITDKNKIENDKKNEKNEKIDKIENITCCGRADSMFCEKYCPKVLNV